MSDNLEKKRKNGSAAKYVPDKRAAVASSDPRRTKLHVNESKNLRGYAMVLVTYDGHEGKATAELHRIFAPYIEALSETANTSDEAITVPASAEQNEESKPKTASDLLQQELDELNAEAKDPHSSKTVKMLTVRTNCKGVFMLRIGSKMKENEVEPSVDVHGLVNQVYQSVSESGSCSRLIVRVIPLQYTCFAGPEEIEAQLEPLIKKHFKDSEPCSYMVVLKRRNNCSFDKDSMVDKIGDMVGPLHKVNLKSPEKVILVEINQSLSGISIIENGDYHRYLEYNLRKHQEQALRKLEPTPSVEQEGDKQ